MNKDHKVPRQIYLSRDDTEELRKLAAESDRTIAWLIRYAVRAFLDSQIKEKE